MSPTAANAPPAIAVDVRCAGCGFAAPADAAFPVRCPRAVPGDDIDHLMTCHVDPTRVVFAADDDPNPFIRYRQLFRAWHLARAAGWSDERYVGLVSRLDRAVASVDGHGFRVTPFARAAGLSDALGFSADGGVWVKDETGNVSGSHKARHLMGIMLALLVAEELDPAGPTAGRPLAIASCGNAALAAAVIAHAAARRLDIFVPPDADGTVLARLEQLHARVERVSRVTGEAGDPTVRRLRETLDAGAIPFTCQGSENGLAIEGGQTIAYELASAHAADGIALDRLVVQVGGGALASSCAQGLATARALGVIASLPRLDAVQTIGAWPLRRAYDLVAARLGERGVDTTRPIDPADPDLGAILEIAAHHRSTFMWAWESKPSSVAHGILDDETYDWLAVVRAMLETGGWPVVVDEATLRAANDLAARSSVSSTQPSGTTADETGTAGLAGLIELLRGGAVGRNERVAVLFTGIRRGSPGPERSER